MDVRLEGSPANAAFAVVGYELLTLRAGQSRRVEAEHVAIAVDDAEDLLS